MARYYTYYSISGTNTPASVGGGTMVPDRRYYFDVTSKQNTQSNTSTVTINKYIDWSTESSNYYVWARSNVDGEIQKDKKYFSGDGLIGTDTFTIEHDDDGEASFTFNGSGTINNVDDEPSSYTYTGTKTITLPKIDRASTITNNTTSSSRKDFGVNVTFSIDRPSSSTTHTLTYKVGSTTYTIGSRITTSKTYAFPTSLISKFTSTATPNITVTCKSSNGTSSSTTVYLKVPNSYVPTCSLSLTDAMNNKPSSLSGLWIKNKSLLKGTITASGIAGSTIKSYLSTVSGSSTNYNTNPFTTTALSNSGEITVTSKVTDTRGRTNTDTETINVIDYDNPAFITAKVERCNSDGTLNELGTYGKVTCKYKIYPINNGTTNLNTKTLTVKMGSGTPQEMTLTNFEDTVTAVLFSDISNNNSYQFTFTLTDIFGSQTQTFTLGIAYVTESKRAGGKGISFGQIASEDGFAVHMPIVKTTEWLNATYPIGSIYVSNTNENPGSKLGGTWELVDKEFKYVSTKNITENGFNFNTSIAKAGAAYFARAGHTISLQLNFNLTADLGDTAATIGSWNLSTLGLSSFGFTKRFCGWSDGGNAIIMGMFETTGDVATTDVVGVTSIPSGNACYFYVVETITPNRMLDEACDKFYWERTA